MIKKILSCVAFVINSVFAFAQTDSTRNKDLKSLSDIVLSNISVPDSILTKPVGETIILEIRLKENKVINIDIWHKGSGFLYDVGKKISQEIQNNWHPKYSFPEIIFYPLRISFIMNGVKVDNKDDLWKEFMTNLKKKEAKSYLILPSPELNYFGKPQIKTY